MGNSRKKMKVKEPEDTEQSGTHSKTKVTTEDIKMAGTENKDGTGTTNNTKTTWASVFEYFRSEDFREKVQGNMEQNLYTAGLTIGIANRHDQAFLSIGLADIATGRAFDENTVVAIGECSTIFTSAAIAKVFDDHPERGGWNAPLSTLLHESFEMSKPEHTEQITVSDLVSNTHCLEPINYVPGTLENVTPLTLTKLVRCLPVKDLNPNRLGNFGYSNIMWSVGARVVEHLSEDSFAEYLSREIFSPAGMHSTFIDSQAASKAGTDVRRATPYKFDAEANRFVELPRMESPEAIGAYSIHSTASDMLQWSKAFCQQTAPVNQRIYADLTKIRRWFPPLSDMHVAGRLINGHGYCAGMDCVWIGGPKAWMHHGKTNGGTCSSIFITDHNLDLSIVVVSNTWTQDAIGLHILFDLWNVAVTGKERKQHPRR